MLAGFSGSFLSPYVQIFLVNSMLCKLPQFELKFYRHLNLRFVIPVDMDLTKFIFLEIFVLLCIVRIDPRLLDSLGLYLLVSPFRPRTPPANK